VKNNMNECENNFNITSGIPLSKNPT
jgi:hypothetical protein